MVRQEWRRVTFVHWPVAVADLAPAVPAPLTLDTLDGYAWLTVTPFSTTCEVLGTLPVPGPRSFPETNVRTYVRGPDGSDGLYFLSLDVTNRSNAAMGRLLGLPYHVGDMVIEQPPEAPSRIRYAGSRRHTAGMACYDVTIEPLGDPKPPVDALDIFLTGRWSAYFRAGNVLFRADVDHEPWSLSGAHLLGWRQTLTTLTGHIEPGDLVVHYSPGVSARLSWPIPVACDTRSRLPTAQRATRQPAHNTA
jgi:uncharacterized protein YqjF (DUF2071 family)